MATRKPGKAGKGRSRGTAGRAARRPARRSSTRGLADLALALTVLEARVAKLEARRARPGDGRAAAEPIPPGVKRCPGCALPLVRRKGRCAECGFRVNGP